MSKTGSSRGDDFGQGIAKGLNLSLRLSNGTLCGFDVGIKLFAVVCWLIQRSTICGVWFEWLQWSCGGGGCD